MPDSPTSAAVVDLLGVLAYAELLAFDRMATDARLAPDLQRRAVLCEMAAGEIGNYTRLVGRMRELGADPEAAMAAFVAPLHEYHEQTEPNDWLEALTKAYVGGGLADDFYRAIASYLDSPDRELVLDVLHDPKFEEFATTEIRAAIAVDPKVANRLSMWARRLVGEALSQAQRIAVERTDLTVLVVAGAGDQAAITALYRRMTADHGARMAAIGLNN